MRPFHRYDLPGLFTFARAVVVLVAFVALAFTVGPLGFNGPLALQRLGPFSLSGAGSLLFSGSSAFSLRRSSALGLSLALLL